MLLFWILEIIDLFYYKYKSSKVNFSFESRNYFMFMYFIKYYLELDISELF